LIPDFLHAKLICQQDLRGAQGALCIDHPAFLHAK
jgi:hypothetical protein